MSVWNCFKLVFWQLAKAIWASDQQLHILMIKSNTQVKSIRISNHHLPSRKLKFILQIPRLNRLKVCKINQTLN